jgi:uncharacterized protein (TIGR03083 family)
VPDVTPDRPPLDVWLSAANRSHRRLVDAVEPLGPEQVTGLSYDDEWSIAQVLSHLGSGAEIFSMFLRAGRRHEPGPGMDEFTPVWDRWNAKAPEAQAADALAADRRFLDEMYALDEHDRRNWTMALFGADQKLVDLMQFRLSEHAVHTWDVVVMADERAAIAPDATALLIDTLAPLVDRVGASTPDAVRVQLHTHHPDRHFLLVAGADGAEFAELAEGTAPGADPTVELPAEALIRLFYGRLDPGHTPDSVGGDLDIDALRRIFTGF